MAQKNSIPTDMKENKHDLTDSLLKFRMLYLAYVVRMWKYFHPEDGRSDLVDDLNNLNDIHINPNSHLRAIVDYLREHFELYTKGQTLKSRADREKIFDNMESAFINVPPTFKNLYKLNSFLWVFVCELNVFDDPIFMHGHAPLPWQVRVHMRFGSDDEGPYFDSSGWHGTEFDYFTISIPKKPIGIEQSLGMVYFYRQFPTLFGSEGRSKNWFHLMLKPMPHEPLEDSINSSTNGCVSNFSGGSLGIVNTETFFVFSEVVLNIIDLYWRGSALHPGTGGWFENHPRTGYFIKEILGSSGDNATLYNASPAVSNYFLWHNPWNFAIRFRVSDAPYDTNGKSPLKNWTNYLSQIKNEITFKFPLPPTVSTTWTTAILDYNATGPEYPFTCM